MLILNDWKFDPLGKYPHLSQQAIFNTLGFIPGFIDAHKEDETLAQTFAREYIAGWSVFQGFEMDKEGTLIYPSSDEEEQDPPLYPLVEVKIGEEVFRMYPNAWVSVTQPDGSFETVRMD